MSQLYSLLEAKAKGEEHTPTQLELLDQMEFHWDKLMYPIFGVIGVLMLWLIIDLWCCMSDHKKVFVPYYLEPTHKEKEQEQRKLDKLLINKKES